MFSELQEINRRPKVFEHYTSRDLWTDEHTSSRMLSYHLDGVTDLSSRKTDFIDRSAAWIISHFGLSAGSTVADFGCGPGLYTIRFAATGADVTGIDFSERSLHYAREQAQKSGRCVDYMYSNYLEFESEKRFDLITLIMCDYCALSPQQRQILLDRFRTHLKPDGAVLLDVYSLRAFSAREESATYAFNLLDGFWSAEPYFGFLTVFKYEAESVVLDKYTIVEDRRTRVIYNWLQYFDDNTLKIEFEQAGFVIEDFIGNVAGDAFDPAGHEFGIVARKSTLSR